MRQMPPADELADIRTQIARLRLREAELTQAMLAAPGAPLNRSRPGWPIQRQGQAAQPALARH